MEIQHTCEEQQSYMDNMIRQMALLTEMIKEVKENRAKSEEYGNAEMEEGVMKAEEESEALPDEAKTTKIELEDEKRVQTDEKSMTPPPDEGTPRESLEEACEESQSNDEAIEREEDIDNTPFYLQSDNVHAPKEKLNEFKIMVKE